MRQLDYIILGVLALIWGSSFILMKKAMLFYTPLEVASIRMVVAGLALSPFAWKLRKELNSRNLLYLVLVGVIGNGLPAVLFTIAETRISSAVAGSLNALTPVFALLFGLMIFKIQWSNLKSLGVLIGFAGALLIVLTGTHLEFGAVGYASLVVLATACYGLSTNLIKSRLQETNAMAIASFSLLAAALPYLIILLWDDTIPRSLVGGDDVMYPLLSILILAVLGTSFALVLFNGLIQRTSAVFGASVTYLIPLVALLLGLIDGEKISSGHLSGLLLILFGIALIGRARRSVVN